MEEEKVDLSFKAPKRKEAAKKGLLLAKKIFEKLNVEFWLSNGTLLGAARDKDLITHDTDLDTGVWDETPDHGRIKRAFMESGFEFLREFGKEGQPGHEYSFYTPGGVHFDIFFYVREAERCWMALWVADGHYRKMIFPPIAEFTHLDLCGDKFPVPKNYVDMLKANYGDDWQTPVISIEQGGGWNWCSSPKNYEKINEQFWEDFYAKPHTLEPSEFAKWAGISGKRIVDFGCGNGRDTHYLAKNNTVIGVDPFAPEGDMFMRCTLQEYIEKNQSATPDVAYCRFLFHAIFPYEMGMLLEWAVKNGVKVYAEFRSTRDVPPPGHERCLVDGNRLLVNMMERGFHIAHYQEGYGLAKYGDEDPHIVRIVTEKKAEG